MPPTPATQVIIVQTADNAFQLALASPEPGILADPADAHRPRVFRTIEICARFAIREFGARRVQLELRN